jgi:hypothetical protein
MFEQHADTAIRLYDGAQVRLKIDGQPKTGFYADASHGGFNIAGSMYYADGTPMDPASPVVIDVIRMH